MIRTRRAYALPLAAVAALAAGCDNDSAAPTGETAGGHAEHAAHGAGGEHAAHGAAGHADGHEHATTGPHEGELIELGDHEYLAELVHNDASVTIYLLEHDGTTPVPIDAQQITVNLLHDGQPEQFQLAASPEAGDAEGKSSRFTIEDAKLAGHLDDDAAKPQLMVTINGTPYSAPLTHHHDHEGHEH